MKRQIIVFRPASVIMGFEKLSGFTAAGSKSLFYSGDEWWYMESERWQKIGWDEITVRSFFRRRGYDIRIISRVIAKYITTNGKKYTLRNNPFDTSLYYCSCRNKPRWCTHLPKYITGTAKFEEPDFTNPETLNYIKELNSTFNPPPSQQFPEYTRKLQFDL